jgi:hypothetical protein
MRDRAGLRTAAREKVRYEWVQELHASHAAQERRGPHTENKGTAGVDSRNAVPPDR